MQRFSKREIFLWALFAASALTAIGFFFVPAFIIRPFSHQSPSGLALAMALRQRAPWWTLGAAIACLLLALILWSAPLGSTDKWRNRGRKAGLSVVMVLVAFSAVMSRLNYFEWMFHPVENLQFDTEAQSKLDKSEMILAIRYGNDARAYPISQMAYHHVVNDVVGGVPVAVTY
jgi:hypothetical protein